MEPQEGAQTSQHPHSVEAAPCHAGAMPDASLDTIRFSHPVRTGREADLIAQVLAGSHWHGDGPFTDRAEELLRDIGTSESVLLTTSCTHALELAGLLLDLEPGDEVIVPSFTFTSTATAIAIRGATPVFVDIEPGTLNLDPTLTAAAVTDRTRAIYVVHYAGVGADMEALQAVADEHGLAIVEDNAHGLGATWRGRTLGTFGALATQSFHDTKNVTAGEGGALVINDPALRERAEVIREKGTNRSQFLRGQVDKYTWVDQGSSFLPSDLLAAVLVAQLEAFEDIQARRQRVWQRYADDLPSWAHQVGARTMRVPTDAVHPAHMFYLMMAGHADQSGLIAHLRERDIVATFHYQPLDSSPAGQRLGRAPRPCPVTEHAATHLVRLPLFADLTETDLDRVVDAVTSFRPAAS